MRLKDITEANKKEPIKARDPNWRDMEALRKSGAAGSHGDKTKTIPRKEKYKKISMEDQFQQYMEANPDTLGKMNDKMRDVLSKVDTDDKAQAQAAKDKAEADRQAKAKELGPQAMDDYITKLKRHDWSYDYSDDHRVWQRGVDERNAIRNLQKVIDPDFEVYNKYAPDGYKVKVNRESTQEQASKKQIDKFHKKLDKLVHKSFGHSSDEKKKESSDIFKALQAVDESATSGATSSASIATVVSPHIAIGNKKARKDYGIRGKQPNPPKAKPIKPTDNALDMKGTSIFGGPLKRS